MKLFNIINELDLGPSIIRNKGERDMLKIKTLYRVINIELIIDLHSDLLYF